ncbi:hypothetical protein [Ostreibacterium oceani]|uniref:Uncharacterized protein n=1 Tax=Ostreibacterium oceani TaxID=2654998 RepID=A0A6N7EUU8_9GAMM|nr:hypothetical protein [Ostreibacterium oceani]MPV85209.1 hypothetical protein [Ostreibacterium oceani]
MPNNPVFCRLGFAKTIAKTVAKMAAKTMAKVIAKTMEKTATTRGNMSLVLYTNKPYTNKLYPKTLCKASHG